MAAHRLINGIGEPPERRETPFRVRPVHPFNSPIKPRTEATGSAFGMTPGRSIPGEIREFQQLELGGWLAELLAQPASGPLGERSRDNLASPVEARSGPETAAHWIQQLERLFDRMGSALDEC